MIIISDCLKDEADEGAIKITSKLARILKGRGKASIYQLNRECSFSDKAYTVGKLGIPKELIKDTKKEDGNILYIPKGSITYAICLKTLILSKKAKKRVFLLPVLRRPVNTIMKRMLKWSKVGIIALSNESYKSYKEQLKNDVYYIRAGVDTSQFQEIDLEKKEKLREKYSFDKNEKVLLHVGHMVEARNLRKFLNIDKKYHVVLVISTSTRWDQELYDDLAKCENITIIHEYLPNIEEMYQLADVYVFQVERDGCIDVPLSCLEAASCGIPVVTTQFGELKALDGSDSFVFIKDFKDINSLIEKALKADGHFNREMALKYEWELAADSITEIVEEKK